MKYGLENIFIEEPLSLIFSIFLVLGISKLGIVFQKYLKKKYRLHYITNHFFSPIFGTYILIFSLPINFVWPIKLFFHENHLIHYTFARFIIFY